LTGTIFDIKEFAVHDGPGIRMTVFLKGCPLRCAWCHNPEGLSPHPQTMTGPAGPRVVGRKYTSDEIAVIVNQQGEILRMNEGGVTFSGGEPLMQADFLYEVLDKLDRLHVLLDTSGYAPQQTFRKVVRRSDLVHFDLKLMDPAAHRKYTGQDNTLILANLHALPESGTPFVVRVPLVPGVTDSTANLAAVARAIAAMEGLLRVELLPYNKAAGGKYRACGMGFRPDYNEDKDVNADIRVFADAGVTAKVC